MVDIVLTLFNKIETLLPIQTFSEGNEQLPSFDEIHSIEIERFNKLHVPKNFGIYLVYDKRTGDVLYIGFQQSKHFKSAFPMGILPEDFQRKVVFLVFFPKKMSVEWNKKN